MVILVFTVVVLQVEYRGDLWQVIVFLMAVTVVAVNLGIFISTFARNELQVVQFIPLVLAPQIFLSGLVLPVEQLPGALQALSAVMPLTYAVDGLREIMLHGRNLGDVAGDLGVLLAFAAGLLALAAGTVRRSA
jgi:ABC-2 type transport system permease protein